MVYFFGLGYVPRSVRLRIVSDLPPCPASPPSCNVPLQVVFLDNSHLKLSTLFLLGYVPQSITLRIFSDSQIWNSSTRQDEARFLLRALVFMHKHPILQDKIN